MSDVADDVLFSGIAALAALVRSRELSPVQLADAFLSRAEAVGPRVGAFVTVAAERARADARRAEADLAAGRGRGVLHGIPFGLADTIDTAGVPTTRGARPYAGRVPERDATVAQRLGEARAVLAGKLSVTELAGALGVTSAAASLSGPCRTPWDLSRWAGGASSGAGAAVAAGLVPFALGPGARRGVACPAAFCGVTALRPTYGVLSRHGAFGASPTTDVLGVVARSAEDCRLVLQALVGADPRDPSSIAPPASLERDPGELPRGTRVGVLQLAARPAPLGGATAALDGAVEALRGAGALVGEARLPELPLEAAAAILAEAESAASLDELIRAGGTRDLADPAHAGASAADYEPRATSADYVRALRIRREAQRALAALFERHDLLLAPNVPFAPPPVDGPLAALAAPDPLAAAIDLAGLPAVALPAGLAAGLPVSVQLVAPPLEEGRLLAAALAFQARTTHHLQRPPVAASSPAVARR